MSQRGACADYGEFPRAKAIPNAFVRVSEPPGTLFRLGMNISVDKKLISGLVRVFLLPEIRLWSPLNNNR